jgi:Fe-Mn family superoxide dismutase
MIDYRELPGAISSKALREHLKLFQGYDDMMGRYESNILTVDRPEKPQLDHQFGQVKWSQGFGLAGVMLHDWYFTNLSLSPKPASNKLLNLISTKFDSLDTLYIEVTRTGLICRGWVVLAQNAYNGEIRIFSMDSHDEGGLFGFIPLLVVDVWEHAYWMDWGSNKKGYLEALQKYVNWSIVEQRML